MMKSKYNIQVCWYVHSDQVADNIIGVKHLNQQVSVELNNFLPCTVMIFNSKYLQTSY